MGRTTSGSNEDYELAEPPINELIRRTGQTEINIINEGRTRARQLLEQHEVCTKQRGKGISRDRVSGGRLNQKFRFLGLYFLIFQILIYRGAFYELPNLKERPKGPAEGAARIFCSKSSKF